MGDPDASIDVLHVEDDPGFAELTATLLEQATPRIDVRTAPDADAGMAALRAHSVDCVVTDHDMPGRTGVEFLRSVRERWPELPVIVFSGTNSASVVTDAIDAGATDWFQKEPGTEQYTILANRICHAVDATHTRRQLAERTRRLEALSDRTHALTYTQTPTETAQLAVDTADELIDAPLTGVHLLNAAETRLELVAHADAVPELFDEPPTYHRSSEPGSRAHLVWEAFRAAEPLHLPNTADDDRLTESTPAASVVLYPLGEHGVFVISSPEPADFSETDVLLVEILANQLEAALDRVDREQTLKTRENRLERLHDATRELVRADSQQAIAEEVVCAAEDILGFSVVMVRLYDDDRGGLVPIAASEMVDELFSERPVFTPDSGSLNWVCFDAGEMQVYDDIEADTAAVDRGSGLRSLMILPLGEYGTISVGETVPRAFDATDTFLARILATATETSLEEHAQETELRRRRDELERQNERLQEFTDVVSHDLRNPLTVATGRVSLARAECDSEHLETVERAHDRMAELIDDLLTLARAGDVIGEPEPVALDALAEACWGQVSTHDAATLEVENDATIVADRTRLRQLLENLFRNSLQHGRADETVPITVRVRVHEDGFAVADDGDGIPAADRGSVFEAGYSSHPDGTGFGLRIVDQIATAHGWAVTVEESPSGGAQFTVSGVDIVA